MPIVDEFTNGYFRRFLFIPFIITIAKQKINPNLTNELCEELSGICNWLIDGIRRLKENKKFTSSDAVNKAFDDFRMESDSVYLFVDELMYKPSVKIKILLSQLYGEFDIWARVNGHNKMTIRTFSKRLKNLGFKIKKSTANATFIWIEKGSINLDFKESEEDNNEEKNETCPF